MVEFIKNTTSNDFSAHLTYGSVRLGFILVIKLIYLELDSTMKDRLTVGTKKSQGWSQKLRADCGPVSVSTLVINIMIAITIYAIYSLPEPSSSTVKLQV